MFNKIRGLKNMVEAKKLTKLEALFELEIWLEERGKYEQFLVDAFKCALGLDIS